MRPIGSDCLPHLRCAIAFPTSAVRRKQSNPFHPSVGSKLDVCGYCVMYNMHTRVIKYRKSPPKLANLHLKIPTVFPFMA